MTWTIFGVAYLFTLALIIAMGRWMHELDMRQEEMMRKYMEGKKNDTAK